MEKKLYYQFSDGSDVENVIMSLDDCANYIDVDMVDCEEDDMRMYTIVPVWLTDEEFEALPEAE